MWLTADHCGLHCLQVYTPDKLHELMADSDYVVAALPSTPSTEKFIDGPAIKAMRSHAVFVNVGRGVTVDEPALIEGELSLHACVVCFNKLHQLPL